MKENFLKNRTKKELLIILNKLEKDEKMLRKFNKTPREKITAYLMQFSYNSLVNAIK